MKCSMSELAPAQMVNEDRLGYQKPRLIRLGEISELTRGNSGSGGDGNTRKPPGQG